MACSAAATMPATSAGAVAVEDELVLGDGDLVGGLTDGVEVGVLGAAGDGLELGARQLERHAQLDQRLHPTQARLDAGGRRLAQGVGAAGIDGRMLPAQRAREIDETARGQRALQGARRLRLDLLPGGVGDGGEFAMEIVHDAAPARRLPMPSEPSPPRGGRGLAAAGGGRLVADDRALLEQVCAHLLLEAGRLPAQPFQHHHGVLALLVAVVGEDGLQLGIAGGVDALVVPVDRLQLLLQRGEGAVAVLGLRRENCFIFVKADR